MGIKSKSFLFGAAVILFGSELLVNILLHKMHHEAWICFITGAIAAVAIFVFVGENNIYSLTNSNIGKIFSIVYVIFFILSAAFNINILASFIGGYVLEETPKTVFIFLFSLLCGYGAKKGYENLLRLAVVFFAIGLISAVADAILLWNKIEVKNFMPLFSFSASDYAVGTGLSVLLLLGDLSVLLCFVNEDTKRKDLIFGVLLGCGFIFITIIRSIGSLGNVTSIYTWPTHEALRIINSGNTLTRIETSSVFIMIAVIFFKVSLFISGAAKGIKKVFASEKDIIWVVICTVMVFVLSDKIFSSGVEAMGIWEKYSFYVIVPIVLIIPLFQKVKQYFQKKLNF